MSNNLKQIANDLRFDVMETVHAVKDGHPGPCMSIADILSVLYFEEMNIDPLNPNMKDRDRMILSKGHACPILYATLAKKGFFPREELFKLRTIEGILQGHPDCNKTPGIDSVSGSLGNGISIGAGIAKGLKIQGSGGNVYVIVGDGEQQEGIIWEAGMYAAKAELNNLIVFSDCNNNQSGGKVTDLTSLYPLKEKWEAFQWQVLEIDGHNFNEIRNAIKTAKATKNKPTMIMAKTVKGKGISYMENNNAWHKRTPTDEELEIARKELKGE